MSLVTRCPRCESAFEVTADQLKLHDGLVRCGQCAHVFDGFAALEDTLPTLTRKVQAAESETKEVPAEISFKIPSTPSNTSPIRQGPSGRASDQVPLTAPDVFRLGAKRAVSVPARVEPKPIMRSVAGHALEPSLDSSLQPPSQPSIEPSLDLRYMPAAVSKEPVLHQTSAAASADEPQWRWSAQEAPEDDQDPPVKVVGEARLRGEDPSAAGRTVPDFMEDDEPEQPETTALWLVGSIMLVLVLIAQLLFVYRNDLASSQPWSRPWLESMCQPIGCEVGYVRRIERIFIVGSSLQQAPASANPNMHAYQMRLTLQNRYNQPQPWPNLLLTLTDASGTAVVRKSVPPSVYLPPDLLARPFMPHQEVSLDIPLAVQGQSASGFEVTKFFP